MPDEDRFRFLYDRLAKYWLPPEEETGNPRHDAIWAFDKAHDNSKGGAPRRIISGHAVVQRNETLAVFDAVPERQLPNWLHHRPRMDKPRIFLRSVVAHPPSSPSIIVKFTKSSLYAKDIFLCTKNVTGISSAGGARKVRNRTVALIRTAGSGLGLRKCRSIRRLALKRDVALDVEDIDRRLGREGQKAKLDDEQLFDLVDLLKDATELEVEAAFAQPVDMRTVLS